MKKTSYSGSLIMENDVMTSTEGRNRDLVEQAFARWATGTGSPYELLADNVSWTIVGCCDASKTYPSREAFLKQVIEPFNSRMKQGLRPEIRQLVATGNTVVIFFDAGGVARDGEKYSNTYAWFWEMAGGRVTRAHAFFDSIAFNELWRRVTP